MRIRCSKGIRINSFHGHFFIRSTDLLALPQVRPGPDTQRHGQRLRLSVLRLAGLIAPSSA